MKTSHSLFVGAAMLIPGILALGLDKAGPAGPWIADFGAYAAQENLQNDYGYADRSETAQKLWLGDLLRRLPEPAGWTGLRDALAGEVSRAPDGPEKQRLQAGAWLMAYLLGDRETILKELPAVPEDENQVSAASYALDGLRQSLEDQEENGPAPEKQMQLFEEQLLMLEPVDLAEVKRALGGEENFTRLQRLVEAGREMEQKMMQVYAEYEKTKDEAAARARMEELQKEFMEKNAADEEALASHIQQPLIRRYLTSLYQEQGLPDGYTPELTVPDLVKFAGREQAEALLRRALRLPVKLGLGSRSGEATGRLARELALAGADTLKAPSWGLAHDTDAGALFEELARRFPKADPKDYSYKTACGYYLAGLIGQGRAAEAVEFAVKTGAGSEINLPYDVLNALERSGQAEQMWTFLKGWLGRHPAAGEWDRFNRLSAQLDRQDELKALIREMAAGGKFAGMDHLRVQRMQADAELATDDLDAAEKRLRVLVQTPAATAEERKMQLDIAEKLLQLADLKGDPAGFSTTLAAAETVLEKGWAEKPDEALNGTAGLVSTLNSVGRFAESARVGRAALDRVPALEKEAAAKKDEGSSLDLPEYALKKLLGEQLRSAVELGNWDEAGRLVQESPWWGAGDVSELLTESLASDRKPLGYYLARVARHQGQDALARRILEAQLVARPGADSIYTAYLELAGKDARPLLVKLAAADRYEERPLIWLAKLQSDAGQWDEAIATLQQAIGIDPSDGEQGRGDRMRVYAFMSRAVAAKGDAEKAAFFDGVVRSIRLSETADRWYDAGAYARAIRLYRESLGFFQDAYCIQSRLAVRLAHEGRMDEAAEHYRRAFELMPDSFGRVESHCFGCEHVFAGEESQGVAEKVFAQMLQARPDKPQLHYLMGYLRQEQKRLPEAAGHYRKAVQLDPLYLNAWDRLAGLEDELHFTPRERDDLLLKLLELDPGRRHVSPDLGRVSDIPRLWHAMEETDRVIAALPEAGALWTLKASAKRISEAKESHSRWYSGTQSKDAAAVLLQHKFIQALQTYLASLNPGKEES